MNSFWFFDDVNLFNLLCPHKFKGYKSCHTFDAYLKNDYIYFEKDQASKIYLIESGKVKIGYYSEAGKEVVKTILTKGELFGEKAILGEEIRNEFAQSIDNKTSICRIGVDTIHELMRDNKTFSLHIYKFLGFRFKKLERRLKILLFKDVKTRLMEFLQELFEQYGHRCQTTGSRIIVHPYTQKDIASLIGTSRPTLNIILNELRVAKIVDFDRKTITIYEKDNLV
ncbi:cyclic nucleotide-binding domain-containing protein [Tenacibaculum finnmarkense genomovar ulcerans]|uniref:Crp/Fnr family transcriptional regulator n=1 Tax=Tenacibaculum finnmarkense TaxID=2781243 RepID=UPI00073921C5|nr:Crp/Fnr family transcriptional regulator [Tenacibaculum finnmarkense]ALU74445.1 transcriptional regulator [Tenacibaculum dicentrarchi]MBE7634476.1 cyclic nucleotide-binding domain-containing protein [Tenacibaculum finnmarkense genomovar ulcerans]MBE7646123.1 cyclic nucleotide-binding domain-containing protein [Tenacibaculum finnmarkense genomovar ulcerans]MCD8430276.1 Crp/Fnr family transcriptional regulator [Tenacibaculum finnmarkense genomovar ulcerans]MCG8763066.1 Crp/Fnr family transcri